MIRFEMIADDSILDFENLGVFGGEDSILQMVSPLDAGILLIDILWKNFTTWALGRHATYFFEVSLP